MFKAILIEKDEQGHRATLRDVDDAQLPEGNVTVKVAASTLNYKDGLAITGRSPTEPTYEIMQRTGRLVGRAAASVCNALDLDLVV